MRRNRLRSYTIDAENEEDYIKQYEMTKSRLSQLIFEKNKIQVISKKNINRSQKN